MTHAQEKAAAHAETAALKAQRRERQRKVALEMRAEGFRWWEIGERLGIGGGAAKAIATGRRSK